MTQYQHPATRAARLLARNLDGWRADGIINHAEAETLQAVIPQLDWLGHNADVIRDTAKRLADAMRGTRLLTAEEIADLARDHTVAAVMASFPGAQIIDGGPLTRPAYTPDPSAGEAE